MGNLCNVSGASKRDEEVVAPEDVSLQLAPGPEESEVTQTSAKQSSGAKGFLKGAGDTVFNKAKAATSNERVQQAKDTIGNKANTAAKAISAKVNALAPGEKASEFLQILQDKGSDAASGFKSKIGQEMEKALLNGNEDRTSLILDAALEGGVIGKMAPASVQNAAQKTAQRELSKAMQTEDPVKLKGALIAAQRLDCTDIPEFESCVTKYKTLRKLPDDWNVSKMVKQRKRGKGSLIVKEATQDEHLKCLFQALLDTTFRKVYTRDRRGQEIPDRLVVQSVVEVQNDQIWNEYVVRQEEIREGLKSKPLNMTITVDTEQPMTYDGSTEKAELISSLLPGPPLDSSVHEVLLFHGTHHIAAQKITTEDFRINLAGSNAGTLYGRGVYLAENCTKGDEYTTPDNLGCRTLLVCRATLGRIFYTDTVETDPRECEAKCLSGEFHTVLGDRKKARGTFREFIVFDDDQVYPNYIVTYKRQ